MPEHEPRQRFVRREASDDLSDTLAPRELDDRRVDLGQRRFRRRRIAELEHHLVAGVAAKELGDALAQHRFTKSHQRSSSMTRRLASVVLGARARDSSRCVEMDFSRGAKEHPRVRRQ